MNTYNINYRDVDGYPLSKNIEAQNETIALSEFKGWCYRNKVAADNITINENIN